MIGHQESARLQYALVDRAVALGWDAARVLVIDDDQGLSGAEATARVGFQRLVTEIGLDHVGLVLGIEMSRLARSGRDWYQLLELCALSGALLADVDGVYDPAEYNDRLLLGLKGTMSEAELHLLKQRMWAGRLNKVRRGEFVFALPSGYIRRPDGQVVFDPDEQVQAVIRLIFAKFVAIGTLHGVLRFLVDHDIRLGIRLREGPGKGLLEWRRPNRMTLQTLLHNLAYAGIYACGRRRVDPRRKLPGRPMTGRVVRDSREWRAVIPAVFLAYITVEQFAANEAKLAANRARAEAMGAPRTGPSLAAGLIWCGRCGRRMTVRHHQQRGVAAAEYWCNQEVTSYGSFGPCQGLSGAPLDAFLEAKVLAALAPAALEVLLHAADQVIAAREQLEKLWAQWLERAAYEADRAARFYRLAEPENRLVTRQLERDWEKALAEQQRLAEEHERFAATHPRTLTAAERQLLTDLAADINGLWNVPTTTVADRKDIVRAIVDRIEVTVVGVSERVSVIVTWAGGAATTGEIVRPVQRLDQLSYYPQLVARIHELAEQGHRARGIARILHEEGYRPARAGKRISDSAVSDLLRRLGCDSGPQRHRAPSLPGEEPMPDEWWLDELATELNMPKPTLYTWINRGWLQARRESRSPTG